MGAVGTGGSCVVLYQHLHLEPLPPNPALPPLLRVSIPRGAPEGWNVSNGKVWARKQTWGGNGIKHYRSGFWSSGGFGSPPPPPPTPSPSSRGTELMRSSALLPALISASRGERGREGRKKGGGGGNRNTFESLPIAPSQGHFCSQQIKAASQPLC